MEDATLYEYRRFREMLRLGDGTTRLGIINIVWTKMWLKNTWGKYIFWRFWKPHTIYLNIDMRNRINVLTSTVGHEIKHYQQHRRYGTLKFALMLVFCRWVLEREAEAEEATIDVNLSNMGIDLTQTEDEWKNTPLTPEMEQWMIQKHKSH